MNEAMITQFVMINADSDQPLKFKKDIEVFQIYGENKFELSNLDSEIIKPEVLNDLIQVQRHNLRILHPAQFSVSLRKLLCLLDEHFQTDSNAEVLVLAINKNKIAQNYQQTNNFDQYFLQLENQSKLRFYNETDKKSIYECSMMKGDLVFVPKNTKYAITNVSDKNAVVLII